MQRNSILFDKLAYKNTHPIFRSNGVSCNSILFIITSFSFTSVLTLLYFYDLMFLFLHFYNVFSIIICFLHTKQILETINLSTKNPTWYNLNPRLIIKFICRRNIFLRQHGQIMKKLKNSYGCKIVPHLNQNEI